MRRGHPLTTPAKAGLEDIVVATSSICYLDGERGVLAYRDTTSTILAEHATFEEVCHLLWHGRLPTRAELGDLQSQLAAPRRLPEGVLRLMRSLPPSNAMDALRTLVSTLAHSIRAPRHVARRRVSHQRSLTAQLGTRGRDLGRMAGGGGIIDPDPALGHAANFLYMLTGQAPEPAGGAAFDVALVLHADHEFNASTFAARVAAATLTDLHSAITAAIGALKGPLHGGANGRDADAARDRPGRAAEKADENVRGQLARKEKIPGFGHRVYRPRTRGPRTCGRCRGARRADGQPQWFEMSQRSRRS